MRSFHHILRIDSIYVNVFNNVDCELIFQLKESTYYGNETL